MPRRVKRWASTCCYVTVDGPRVQDCPKCGHACSTMLLSKIKGATVGPDSVVCDECRDLVPRAQAFFLPFATLCEREQCEINARRKFDNLPVEAVG